MWICQLCELGLCECLACGYEQGDGSDQVYDDHTCGDWQVPVQPYDTYICRHELAVGECAICSSSVAQLKDVDRASGRATREYRERWDWAAWAARVVPPRLNDRGELVVPASQHDRVVDFNDADWVSPRVDERRLRGKYRRIEESTDRPPWLRVHFNKDYFLGFYRDHDHAASSFPPVAGPELMEVEEFWPTHPVTGVEDRRISRHIDADVPAHAWIETVAHTQRLRERNAAIMARLEVRFP